MQRNVSAAVVVSVQNCAGTNTMRCDMAMLVLPEVFERTWGIRADSFWPRATNTVNDEAPGFLFLTEVYWDLEWTLQQQGFDYTYDKRLYDRLHEGHARLAREHLLAGLDFQDKLVRFLENHDEPRTAATFPPEVHRPAAIITFLITVFTWICRRGPITYLTCMGPEHRSGAGLAECAVRPTRSHAGVLPAWSEGGPIAVPHPDRHL